MCARIHVLAHIHKCRVPGTSSLKASRALGAGMRTCRIPAPCRHMGATSHAICTHTNTRAQAQCVLAVDVHKKKAIEFDHNSFLKRASSHLSSHSHTDPSFLHLYEPSKLSASSASHIQKCLSQMGLHPHFLQHHHSHPEALLRFFGMHAKTQCCHHRP